MLRYTVRFPNCAATVMVIDGEGELKLVLPYDLMDEHVAADLARCVG